MSPEPLDKQIEHILSLDEDFDGEGGIPPGRETVDRALRYIPIIKQRLLEEKGVELEEIPYIDPVADGGIDLHWKTQKYELLLNVPVEDKPAGYYGDNYKGDEFKGNIELDNSKE